MATTCLETVIPPGSRTDGTTSDVHATTNGRSTVCGRVIEPGWATDRLSWALWTLRDPSRRCRECAADVRRMRGGADR